MKFSHVYVSSFSRATVIYNKSKLRKCVRPKLESEITVVVSGNCNLKVESKITVVTSGNCNITVVTSGNYKITVVTSGNYKITVVTSGNYKITVATSGNCTGKASLERQVTTSTTLGLGTLDIRKSRCLELDVVTPTYPPNSNLVTPVTPTYRIYEAVTPTLSAQDSMGNGVT